MYVVTVVNMGNQFWLRSTTWASYIDRADKFESVGLAQAAIDRAAKFMAPKIRKSLKIVSI